MNLEKELQYFADWIYENNLGEVSDHDIEEYIRLNVHDE